MKNINLESNSSSMVNISHEILFVLRCLAYFWNSATLRELSKCILYQIHTEFFLIVEFSGPPNLAGQKDLLKTGESSNLAGRRIYRAMTVVPQLSSQLLLSPEMGAVEGNPPLNNEIPIEMCIEPLMGCVMNFNGD